MIARATALPATMWIGLSISIAGCDPEPTEPAADPWPRTEQCEGLEAWPSASAQLERDVLLRLDDLRDEGVDCGERGKYGPVPLLVRRSALDCAARFHARDMATQGYVGRVAPDGTDEQQRVEAAGHPATVVLQHVAAGPRDAEELIDRTWLPRPVPCSSLVSDQVTEVGLGHVGEVDDDFVNYWVIVLAAP